MELSVGDLLAMGVSLTEAKRILGQSEPVPSSPPPATLPTEQPPAPASAPVTQEAPMNESSTQDTPTQEAPSSNDLLSIAELLEMGLSLADAKRILSESVSTAPMPTQSDEFQELPTTPAPISEHPEDGVQPESVPAAEDCLSIADLVAMGLSTAEARRVLELEEDQPEPARTSSSAIELLQSGSTSDSIGGDVTDVNRRREPSGTVCWSIEHRADLTRDSSQWTRSAVASIDDRRSGHSIRYVRGELVLRLATHSNSPLHAGSLIGEAPRASASEETGGPMSLRRETATNASRFQSYAFLSGRLSTHQGRSQGGAPPPEIRG